MAPAPRTPGDILAGGGGQPQRAAGPKARSKWPAASVVEDAAEVAAQVFDEADRRDPGRRRCWAAPADGNNHRLDRITTQARRRGVAVAIVVDFIHVLEDLRRAAWCFSTEGGAAAEEWVRGQAMAVLPGRSRSGPGQATRAGLQPEQRTNADTCADCLINKRPAWTTRPRSPAAGRSPPA